LVIDQESYVIDVEMLGMDMFPTSAILSIDQAEFKPVLIGFMAYMSEVELDIL
jgi:hypothetical protein